MQMPNLKSWKLFAGILAIFSVIGLLYAMGCLTREHWQIRSGTGAQGFAALSGGIGVRFTSWSNNSWHFKNFILRAGTVEMTDSLPPAPENALTGGGESRALWLSDIPSVPYDGPYSRSPDGTLVAAGVHKTGRRYSANSLVIAKLATSEVITRTDSRGEWGILGVAWSPDGQYVAIMKLQSQFRYCLGDLISTAIGHPVRLNTLSLVVFDLEGNVVAELPLIENTPRWGAEVVWVAE